MCTENSALCEWAVRDLSANNTDCCSKCIIFFFAARSTFCCFCFVFLRFQNSVHGIAYSFFAFQSMISSIVSAEESEVSIWLQYFQFQAKQICLHASYRPDEHGYVYFPLSYVRLVAVYKEWRAFAISSECYVLTR